MSLLGTLVPIISTALGGPLAGAAVEFVADKLGVSGATKDQIANTIQGLDPLKAKELDYQFQEFMAAQGIAIQLAQIQVNTEEAKSSHWFIAASRPAVIWICAIGFAYATIIEPVMRFVATVMFKYTGAFPTLNIEILVTTLFALLGLSGLKSYDKQQGTDTTQMNTGLVKKGN